MLLSPWNCRVRRQSDWTKKIEFLMQEGSINVPTSVVHFDKIWLSLVSLGDQQPWVLLPLLQMHQTSSFLGPPLPCWVLHLSLRASLLSYLSAEPPFLGSPPLTIVCMELHVKVKTWTYRMTPPKFVDGMFVTQNTQPLCHNSPNQCLPWMFWISRLGEGPGICI